MKLDKVTFYTLIAQAALSVVLVAGFFLSLAFAWFSNVEIPPERLRVIDTMNGSLGAAFIAVVSYWFARQRNAVAEAPPTDTQP